MGGSAVQRVAWSKVQFVKMVPRRKQVAGLSYLLNKLGGGGGREGRRGTNGILLERLRRRLWAFLSFFLSFFFVLVDRFVRYVRA